MKRILVLGGIREAREFAGDISGKGMQVVYSVVGITARPNLSCDVHEGGFGGSGGLFRYLSENRIEILVDATHPYAGQISSNASDAARRAGIPLWVYRRPSWQPRTGDDWRYCRGWDGLVDLLATFRRPFFTVGRTPLENLDSVAPHQHWVVRSLETEPPVHPRLTAICARGPFVETNELQLMREHRVDVLVAKNSGGCAVAAKLAAARALGLPVLMLERPAPVDADRSFQRIGDLVNAVLSQ